VTINARLLNVWSSSSTVILAGWNRKATVRTRNGEPRSPSSKWPAAPNMAAFMPTDAVS
jgi:hypothetical protein